VNDHLDKALDFILRDEAGYAERRLIPGGAVNKGIDRIELAQFLGRYVSKGDLKHLTVKTAKAFYEERYAKPIEFDTYAPGVGYAVLNFAIMDGVATSLRILGGILDQNASAPPDIIIELLCERHLDYKETTKGWRRFHSEWTSRIHRVSKRALLLWQQSLLPTKTV
jgi:lysozyme family protein